MRNYVLYILSFLLLVFYLQNCSDSPSESQNGIDTTNRNFEWKADTLWTANAATIYMYDIWGSSNSDIWTVGHSDDSQARIWHWNGEIWQSVKPEFESWGALTYRRIIGFGEDDFWIVGSTSRRAHPWDVHGALIHYNNGAWELYDPEGLPAFWSIGGTSSKNLLVGALDGSIYHYDGYSLSRIKTGIESRYASQVNAITAIDEHTIYAKASHYDTTQSINTWYEYFYRIENLSVNMLDSFALSWEPVHRFGNALWGNKEILLSGSSDGVFRYIDGSWQEEFGWTTIYDIYGSSSNNIFAGTFRGGLFHFNGENWQQIEDYKSSGQTIWAIWCNENSVFLVQDLGNYGQIVQGKRLSK